MKIIYCPFTNQRCRENECALWTYAYWTQDKGDVYKCSLVVIAESLQNIEGKKE